MNGWSVKWNTKVCFVKWAGPSCSSFDLKHLMSTDCRDVVKWLIDYIEGDNTELSYLYIGFCPINTTEFCAVVWLFTSLVLHLILLLYDNKHIWSWGWS